MINFFNIIGRFKLYSFVDLILLLFAVGADKHYFAGAIFLNLSFLFFYDWRHKKDLDLGTSLVWVCLLIVGFSLFFTINSLLFIAFGILYTETKLLKNQETAPILRGFQYYFLISFFTGYFSFFPVMVLILMILRNFASDLRDVEEDARKNVWTLPRRFWLKKEYGYIHLLFVMGTSAFWVFYNFLNPSILFLAWIVQISTYYIGK